MKIGFIGLGNMGKALLDVVLRTDIAGPANIYASDKYEGIEKIGGHEINIIKDNKRVVSEADMIFLCVKPQDMEKVLKEIKKESKDKLIISIAAGITTATIEKILSKSRVIRVMPNLGCLIGESASAFCLGKKARVEDKLDVAEVLDAAGISVEVKEDQMDAVTGLSGSGPAFIAYIMDAMVAGAVKEGLKREDALKLCAQTMIGTGKVLMKEEPVGLIKRVKSPGGTTEEGMKFLEKSDVNENVSETIRKAAKRSRELGK